MHDFVREVERGRVRQNRCPPRDALRIVEILQERRRSHVLLMSATIAFAAEDHWTLNDFNRRLSTIMLARIGNAARLFLLFPYFGDVVLVELGLHVALPCASAV